MKLHNFIVWGARFADAPHVSLFICPPPVVRTVCAPYFCASQGEIMLLIRKFANAFLLGFGLLATLILLIFSVQAFTTVAVSLPAILALLLFIAGVAVIIYLPNTKFVRLTALAVILALGFGIRLFWTLQTRSYPTLDFWHFYDAAYKFSQGYKPFFEKPFFLAWPYQNGFAIYEGWLMKLVTSAVLNLQIVNILVGTVTILATYLLASELFNSRSGLIAAYLCATFAPFIYMSSVLTNQMPATACYMFGIWLMIRGQKKLVSSWWWLLAAAGAGILIGLGNILRPLASLILMATILFYLFYMFGSRRSGRDAWLKPLAFIAIVFGMYAGTMGTANFAITATNTAPYKLVNRDPSWKLVTGLNVASNGMYSKQRDDQVAKYAVGSKARHNADKRIIKQELQDKKSLLRLFVIKFKYMWASVDTSYQWAINNTAAHITPKNANQKLAAWRFFQAGQWLLLFLAFGCGLFAILNPWRNTVGLDRNAILLIILWFGYISAHLLIEVQLRYRFFIMPSVMVIAALGIAALVERLRPLDLGRNSLLSAKLLKR